MIETKVDSFFIVLSLRVSRGSLRKKNKSKLKKVFPTMNLKFKSVSIFIYAL